MRPNFTREQMQEVLEEAEQAAYMASKEYFETQLGSRDSWPCGFAWVEVSGVDGRSKMGKVFKELDVHQYLWNPAKFSAQNVDTLYAGAQAAAMVLRKHGFNAYPSSRID